MSHTTTPAPQSAPAAGLPGVSAADLPADSRRLRVSVFPVGTTSLFAACERHHACKTKERAVMLAEKYAKAGDGRRVVLHFGNLRRGSHRILSDTHPAPARIDVLTAKLTAFATFAELATAPGYRPSFNVANPDYRFLADAYDAYHRRAGTHREAFRYDAPTAAQLARREHLSKIDAEFGSNLAAFA